METYKVIKCPDGHFRRAIFSLRPYIADYPEQVWLTGIVSNWCLKYVTIYTFVLCCLRVIDVFLDVMQCLTTLMAQEAIVAHMKRQTFS